MANVEIQQAKLNELFAGYGMAELAIDGVSGSVTRQRLCAARMALGLPPSTADMAAGSEEEQVLMAATQLNIPLNAPVEVRAVDAGRPDLPGDVRRRRHRAAAVHLPDLDR